MTDAMTTTTTTDQRAERITEAADEWATQTGWEPETAGDLRFLLIECNERGGGYWLTTHDTAPAARRANRDQEYAADWQLVAILDLDGITEPGELIALDVSAYTFTDEEALDAIADQLTGREWGADELDAIADAVRRTGRTIGAPE